MYPLNSQYGAYGRSNSNLDWIIVQTIEQAETVQVQPNTKAWIMIQNEPVFALRSADNMGLVTTEFYRFERFEPHRKPEYVTADQFNQAIEDLRKELRHEPINDERTEASNSASNDSKRKTDHAGS